MGRLPAETGGRPAAPNREQAGKAAGPGSQDSRVAETNQGNRMTAALHRSGIRFFHFKE